MNQTSIYVETEHIMYIYVYKCDNSVTKNTNSLASGWVHENTPYIYIHILRERSHFVCETTDWSNSLHQVEMLYVRGAPIEVDD